MSWTPFRVPVWEPQLAQQYRVEPLAARGDRLYGRSLIRLIELTMSFQTKLSDAV